MDENDYDYDGAIAELAACCAMLRNLATGNITPVSAAWWLVANFRNEYDDDLALRAIAEKNGPPPKGTWDEWLNPSKGKQE